MDGDVPVEMDAEPCLVFDDVVADVDRDAGDIIPVEVVVVLADVDTVLVLDDVVDDVD